MGNRTVGHKALVAEIFPAGQYSDPFWLVPGRPGHLLDWPPPGFGRGHIIAFPFARLSGLF